MNFLIIVLVGGGWAHDNNKIAHRNRKNCFPSRTYLDMISEDRYFGMTRDPSNIINLIKTSYAIQYTSTKGTKHGGAILFTCQDKKQI